jgi:hypothetical protein
MLAWGGSPARRVGEGDGAEIAGRVATSLLMLPGREKAEGRGSEGRSVELTVTNRPTIERGRAKGATTGVSSASEEACLSGRGWSESLKEG